MKVSIHFSLASGKASDLPIRMRVSYDGLRLDLRTGFVCPPDRWDASAMRVRAGAVNRYGEKASVINRALSREESVLSDILARYELDAKVPEPRVLKADFERAMGRKPSRSSAAVSCDDSFSGIFRRYIVEYGSDASLAPGTIESYTTVLNRVEASDFANLKPDEITERHFYDFINAMFDLGFENQTISVWVVKLKTILRYARRLHLYHGTLPEDFSYKFKGLGQKDVHYLDWSDVEKLLNCPLERRTYCLVRDAFCFCCSTGIRISDCIKLRWQDVNLVADVPYISVETKKTFKPVTIELNRCSRAVIDRRLALAGGVCDPSSRVFPRLLTSTSNTLLPKIAAIAGVGGQVREISFVGNECKVSIVDKADAISTHWGRHTFIVHALHLGISPNVIMSWTGHSSYESMKPYIAIADCTKEEKMALFDKD